MRLMLVALSLAPAQVGGKDVELHLWDTETGELLSTLRGHEVAWTSSNDNTFFVTVQEDSKVQGTCAAGLPGL
jgi:WD40 repeat protein